MLDDGRWLEVQRRNREFLHIVEEACAEGDLRAMLSIVVNNNNELYLMFPNEISTESINNALITALNQHTARMEDHHG